MRIVVTGAAGFVGRPTCRLLATQGHSVTPVTRGPASIGGSSTLALGDFTAHTVWDPVLEGADVVVHLAGRAHVMHDNPHETERLYERANVAVTETLADAARRTGVPRFVFISSIKVNGEETHGAPFTAETPPAPEDAYGRSKLAAEQRLRAIAGDAMDWVILRPPLMYGSDMRGNLERLEAWARRGRPLPFASIRNARDLLNVEAFADLIALAATHPAAANRVFLACDGSPLSTPDLVGALASRHGRSARLLPFPPSLMKLAGRLMGRSAEVRRLAGDLRIDDRATREALGWRPGLTTLEALAKSP